MDIKGLLPIGSVVLLQEAEKKLMVIGVKQTSSADNKEYDYIGVVYPEGYISPEYQYLFNHQDIDMVFFEGYKDDERVDFIARLADYYQGK